MADAQGELVLLGILVRAAQDVAGGRGVGVGHVLVAGQRAGVLRLRIVREAQPQRAQGGAAHGVVHPGVELAELRGAVLPEAVGLELRDATGCR